MTTSHDLEHLLRTVEEARLDIAPEVDGELLAAVIRAEDANPDDERAALIEVRRVIDGRLTGTSESA